MPPEAPEPSQRTVTVGGLPGTGTSTLCGILERRLGLPYIYAGQLFRQEAARRGLSLAELNALSQQDDSIDRTLDERQLELLGGGGVILEGRMSGWLARKHGIPALKVWVVCDPQERVRRLVQRDGGDPDEQRRATIDREQMEAERYLRYYGADPSDESIYDLILDSTHETPDRLADDVVQRLSGREGHILND